MPTVPAALDAPLCGDRRADRAVREALASILRLLHDRLGERPLGVVLTGSFARGEGTVVAVDDGLRVLGDLELFVVLPGRGRARRLRAAMAAWSREASAMLGGEGLTVDVELGPVDEDWLVRRARPAMFVHDLLVHGRVLAGPRDLLARAAPVPAEAIPREDAVQLVFNRIVEQLETWERLPALGGPALLDVAYQRLKLTLDLAGSALAFAGTHTASYAARPIAFSRLTGRTPVLARLLPAGFALELEQAARVKLDPAGLAGLAGAPAAEARERLRAALRDAVPATTALLRWELGRLTGGAGPLPSLLERYGAAEGLRSRLRGWAKLAVHPMPAPVPVSVTRAARLVGRASPRTLAYAAATLAYLRLADGADGHANGACRLLPLARRAAPRSAADERRAIAAFWRWCVRND